MLTGQIQVIPANIYDLLTPIALAYWICGDESYNRRDGVVILCTDSFTTAEVDK